MGSKPAFTDEDIERLRAATTDSLDHLLDTFDNDEPVQGDGVAKTNGKEIVRDFERQVRNTAHLLFFSLNECFAKAKKNFDKDNPLAVRRFYRVQGGLMFLGEFLKQFEKLSDGD